MKTALNAKHPNQKLSALVRIHSKLIFLSERPECFNEKDEDGNFIFDNILESLENLTICFLSNNNDKKIQRSLNKYLKSLQQVKYFVNLYRKDPNSFRIRSFYLLSGNYDILRKKIKKSVTNLCEIEYQNLCVPMCELCGIDLS